MHQLGFLRFTHRRTERHLLLFCLFFYCADNYADYVADETFSKYSSGNCGVVSYDHRLSYLPQQYITLDSSAAYVNATANSFLLGALWKRASGTVTLPQSELCASYVVS